MVQPQMPLMMPMMMPQMMLPQMMQQQLQPQQDRGDDDDSSSDSSSSSSMQDKKRYQKADDNNLTRSAIFLGKLPKVRLLQLVEACNREVDSTLTADLETEDLTRLIYILTRVKPQTKCVLLRVKTYKA